MLQTTLAFELSSMSRHHMRLGSAEGVNITAAHVGCAQTRCRPADGRCSRPLAPGCLQTFPMRSTAASCASTCSQQHRDGDTGPAHRRHTMQCWLIDVLAVSQHSGFNTMLLSAVCTCVSAGSVARATAAAVPSQRASSKTSASTCKQHFVGRFSIPVRSRAPATDSETLPSPSAAAHDTCCGHGMF